MSKYREQVFRLLMASKRDDPTIVTQLKEQHTNVSNKLYMVINMRTPDHHTRMLLRPKKSVAHNCIERLCML